MNEEEHNQEKTTEGSKGAVQNIKQTKEILEEEQEQPTEVKEEKERQSWEQDIEVDALQTTGNEDKGAEVQGNKNMLALEQEKGQDEKLEKKHEVVPEQKEKKQEEPGTCPKDATQIVKLI